MLFSKPRVIILHYTAPPIVGGVEAVIAEHARLLTAAGYPTTLVSGRGGAADLPQEVGVEIVPEIDSAYPQNVEIAAALDSGNVPTEFSRLQARIASTSANIMREGDIVFAHNVLTTHFNLPLTAAIHQLVDRGTIRRLIVWTHDVSRYVNQASGATLRFGYPWDLLRTKRAGFVYVAVSSRRRRTLAEVLNCPADHIRVVPNGVDPAMLLGLSDLGQHLVEEHGLLSADLVVLMPVRITRAKNIEFALHVVAALKSAGATIRLVITGPPDPHSLDAQAYYAGLKALRDELRLGPEVVFIYDGTSRYPAPLLLHPSTIAELYRVSDLVLMSSHREGFGMPILEAAIVDRPVFTTHVPVIDDLDEDSVVHLIPPDESPQTVAGRMLTWASQDLAHRLRRLARRNYTWSTIFSTSIEPLLKDLAEPLRSKIL
ncbi:MAG TPA: glycosyltransferase family 4 protein [Anaerolineales bacterium]|nr:glycosyltransferase family 4 protein [Anaerolineales bacterium]